MHTVGHSHVFQIYVSMKFICCVHQDPASRGVVARPGERYSELLIRQAQEDSIQQQLHDERVAAGILVPENPPTHQQPTANQADDTFVEEVVWQLSFTLQSVIHIDIMILLITFLLLST
jgi:hypothetical protein